MSRSYRKHPIRGNCSDSEKWDKQKAHRKLRHAFKLMLKEKGYEDLIEDLDLKDVSTIWTFNKDGKHWFGGDWWQDEEGEDNDWFEKAMRK